MIQTLSTGSRRPASRDARTAASRLKPEKWNIVAEVVVLGETDGAPTTHRASFVNAALRRNL